MCLFEHYCTVPAGSFFAGPRRLLAGKASDATTIWLSANSILDQHGRDRTNKNRPWRPTTTVSVQYIITCYC